MPRPRIQRPRVQKTATVRRLALGLAAIAVVAAAGLLAGRWAADDGSQTGDAPARIDAASASYVDGFNEEVDSLRADRKAELERLKAARTPGAQAESLEALAERHTRAAERVAGLDAPAELRGANEFAIAALERVAGAYGGLAEAAGSQDSAEYKDGLEAVRRAELRLGERLERN